MRKLAAMLMTLILFVGCGAGTAYDVLAHDNVIAAALEAKKGVEAFNETVIADTAARRANLVKTVGNGVKATALAQAVGDKQAEALAQDVMAELTRHLNNYAEQERRRANLFEVTIDNLNYIIQISEQGKKFALYRADIGLQWKQYLESSARDVIGSID